MSHVLTMVLAVVTGSGPEMVSGEPRQIQSLDLRGEWEGVVWGEDGEFGPATLNYSECLEGQFKDQSPIYLLLEVRDEGGGKFSTRGYRGIYQQDGPRLTLCFREDHKGRPVSFWGGDGQALAILRRVKPRK